MALTPTFDTMLSRIRLAATGLTTGTTASFERSLDNLKWTTVRGGSAVPISVSDTANLDDYEFTPGVVNYYRVKDTTHTFSTTITPSQSGVWLKSIARPFLNRQVNVIDHSDISRPSRNGVFEVVGRSLPVSITDVRSSRRWTMVIQTPTVSDADALDVVFASGDPLFIQTDGEHDIPGGYVVVGDTTRNRFGHLSVKRTFDVPCTEVAPPGPDIVGATSTWESLVAEFGTWADVLAFFGTWAAVADYVSSPDVVIVP